nr:protein NYNRIN-like [Tanacetum cinerariifolium]
MVNILDFCEEHYEDILSVIMDKIRRDKRKEVHARLDFGESPKKSRRVRESSQNSSAGTLPTRVHSTDLAILTRQAQLSPGRTGQTLGIVLTVEVALADGTFLLAEIALEAETASAASKNHMHEKRKGKRIPVISCVEERHQRWRTLEVKVKKMQAYSSRKTRMPNNVKTYDGTGDPEDPVKIFHAAAQVKRWAMPTWCHMFNFILIGTARVWFDELPPESINGYKDLKAAFLAYFMQQKKYVKDPMEIHNIKQRDGETIEDFMEEIMFPLLATNRGTEGPLVIEVEIGGYMIHRMRCRTFDKSMDEFHDRKLNVDSISGKDIRLSDRRKGARPRLKNAGATYQRLVDKAFDSQVGRNIEMYVDDLVIKSHTETEMLRDIDETFSLKPKEELIVYMSASHEAISAVLMTERDMILADFLVEKPDEAPPNTLVVETPQEPWTLFTDGSSCVDGSGVVLILISPEGMKFTYALRFQFTAFNNKAEYEALIACLWITAHMGVRNMYVSVDSKLVANQVIGTHVAKEENMIKYLEKAKSLVLVKVLKEKSIQEKEVATVVEEDGPTWMTLIMEYLKDGTLPNDRKEASKLPIKARQYELLEGVLYRRSFLKPWLRCVGPLQPNYVIREIHEGSCSMHVGPRTKKVKFLIVAMDYFTKWIEMKAVATITDSQVKKFVLDNIVCRFGLPGEIVSDNGKQFSDNLFKDWCEKLNITQRFASVKHPQSNGLIERANGSLDEGIKACLGEGNKNWIEELPHVLWAHRTNDEELRLNLDLLEERRERAAIREAKAKLKMTKYYNSWVRGVTFRPRDFVYHSNDASHAVDRGKLGPKWEGPYEVIEALRDGAYRIRSMDGTVLPQTLNIANLKKCYL